MIRPAISSVFVTLRSSYICSFESRLKRSSHRATGIFEEEFGVDGLCQRGTQALGSTVIRVFSGSIEPEEAAGPSSHTIFILPDYSYIDTM